MQDSVLFNVKKWMLLTAIKKSTFLKVQQTPKFSLSGLWQPNGEKVVEEVIGWMN
jgi:hypothetical protein